MFKRKKILLKISGELLASPKEPVDLKKAKAVAQEIAKISKKGIKIGLVVGGGNIFRGRQIKNREIIEVTGHYMGMVGTVVNSLALRDVLLKTNCPAKVISALPLKVAGISAYLNRHDLRSKDVLIFAGGTGRPYVTTDTAAVQRALAIKADILFKGTKVEGVYSADPVKNKKAKKYDRLRYSDYLKKNLQVMDPGAVLSAQKNKLPIYVFKWGSGELQKAVSGKAKGSLIS